MRLNITSRNIGVTLVILAISGCAHRSQPHGSQEFPGTMVPAVIEGYTLSNEKVVFTVHDYGCTNSSHFSMVVTEKKQSNPEQKSITLIRPIHEPCRREKTLINIEFSREDFHLSPDDFIVVGNVFGDGWKNKAK